MLTLRGSRTLARSANNKYPQVKGNSSNLMLYLADLHRDVRREETPVLNVVFLCSPHHQLSQVEVMGQALGCVDALAEPEESDSKRTTSPISNGDQSHAKPHQEVQDEQQQCFALCNRDDNESVQGLVRSGGCLWLGTFTLPPIPQGEDEDQVGRKDKEQRPSLDSIRSNFSVEG